MFRHEAYLIGMRGEVVHQWTSLPLLPGAYAYMLKNGNLLWAGRTAEGCPLQAGKGGLLREYDWDGNVLHHHLTRDKEARTPVTVRVRQDHTCQGGAGLLTHQWPNVGNGTLGIRNPLPGSDDDRLVWAYEG